MSQFRNMDALEEYVIKQVEKAMKEKFYDVCDTVFHKYVEEYYNEYTPSVYPRLEEFKDKIAREIKCYRQGKSIITGIEFTPENLSLNAWARGKYHHGGTRESAREIMYEELIDGTHQGEFENGTAIYEETKDELIHTDVLIEALKKELRDNGFTIR